ncbi:hypothetical protein Tco_0745470 [Tanacetum coccineum]
MSKLIANLVFVFILSILLHAPRSQARKRRQQQVQQTSVEPPNLEKPNNNPSKIRWPDYIELWQIAPGSTEVRVRALPTPESISPNAVAELKDMGYRASTSTVQSDISSSSSRAPVKSFGDTKTFSYNIIESVNRVDVIDIACEEYVQEVLEISESGNPTSTSDLMIDSRSPSFTPFGGSDFLMEEIDALS